MIRTLFIFLSKVLTFGLLAFCPLNSIAQDAEGKISQNQPILRDRFEAEERGTPARVREESKCSKNKNYKGKDIPIEWTNREPASKEASLKLRKGDSFDKAIEFLGVPFQDSGENKQIWHYRLDDGSYLQLIGRERIEKIMRYSDKDIKQ